MHEDFGLCCIHLVDVCLSMHAFLHQFHRVDANMPQTMSPSGCAHTTIYMCRPWSLMPLVYWCRFSDGCMPKIIFPRQWSQTTAEVTQPMCRRQANAWKPWQMLHVIWRNHLPDMHMPRPCMQSLSDASCHWVTSLSRYRQSTFDFESLGWSTMPLASFIVRSTKVTSHACKFFVILPLILRYHQTNVCRIRMILDGYIRHQKTYLLDYNKVGRQQSMLTYRFLQAIDNAVRNHSTSVDRCVHDS